MHKEKLNIVLKINIGKLKKIFLKSATLFLIVVWIFSGWPQIFGFPPGVQKAYAAVSFVGSCSNNGNNGANATLTLPVGTAENDLVIVAYGNADADNVDLNMVMVTADYTEVADLFSNDTFDANMGVYYKFMGSTPDTQAVADNIGGADTDTPAVCMVFRGVDTTTPMDVTDVEATALNSMDPNPGSINHNNPFGVWTVIAGANAHNLGATGSFTFPTGYTTDAIQIAGDDTADGRVGMGYNSGPADPEDPGVMTDSLTDGTSFAWVAVTMALRPAVAPTVTTQAASSVTATTATLNGNITATGGISPNVRGFAWGTNSGLSGGDTATTTENGDFGTGAFTNSSLTFVCNTTYYSRAYATNSIGTSLGAISASFTTSACSASLTLIVSTDTFPNVTPGTYIFATSTISVDTDNSAGWNVTLSRDDADTTLDLSTDATVNITDQTAWVPGADTSQAGNSVRMSLLDSSGDVLAFRLMTASGSASFISTAWWGNLDKYVDDSSSFWAGLPSSGQQIGNSSSSSGGGPVLNTVLYYLDVSSTQRTGTYNGGIT